MIVELDPNSAIPPFEQLRSQIERAVVGGTLLAGHRLPPIRQLARDLGIAPGTVARAYRELETAGLLHTRGRHGTVVASNSTDLDQTRLAQEAAARAVLELKQMKISLREAKRLIADAYVSSDTEES